MGTVKQKLERPFLGLGNLNEQTSSCVIHCYSGKIGTGAFLPVKLPLSKVSCRDIHQYEAVDKMFLPWCPMQVLEVLTADQSRMRSFAAMLAPSLLVLGLCPRAARPERQHRADVCRAVECSDHGHWSDFLSKVLVPALQVLHMAPGGCLPLAATGVLLKTPELWNLSKIRRGESACVWDRCQTPEVSDIWAEG